MDSFIFKGKSSKDFKIIINSLPTISKPPLRVEEIEIDGVDGVRYEELGYGCYEKKIKITITENNIDSLINWLKGEGDLILSNEPDKYYNAKIIEQIDFERLMKYEPTEIKFRVQPFKYQYNEEKMIASTGTVEGTKIKISDVKATQMQIDGRSTQKIRSGIQKFRENGFATKHNNTDFWNTDEATLNSFITILENGWVRFKANNSSSSDKIYNFIINRDAFDLISDTQYTLVLEFRNVVNNNSNAYFNPIADSPNASYFTSVRTIMISSITEGVQKILLESKSDLSRATQNSYMYLSAGESCEFECRMSLLQGDYTSSEYVYEAYGVSPSLDYPSEIESVGYKNLFNKDLYTYEYVTQNSTSNVDGYKTIPIYVGKTNTNYYVSTNFLNGYSPFEKNNLWVLITNVAGYIDAWVGIGHRDCRPSDTQLYNNTITSDGNGYLYLRVNNNTSKAIYDELMANVETQIEEGTQKHSYITFGKYGIEVKTTNGTDTNTSLIILDRPLRNLPNGVKDIAYIKNNKLYVDRKLTDITIDTSQLILIDSYTNISYAQINKPDNFIGKGNLNYQSLFCSCATETNDVNVWDSNNKINKITAQPSTNDIWIGLPKGTTLEQMQIKLAGAVIQYELATPYTEEICDLTILQLVDGENNISNSEDANMIIDYIETLNVNNLGNHTSKPIFEIEGVGKVDFILNNSNVFSYNFDDDGKVVIDSEKEDAYLESVLKNRNMNGDFPIFNPGENKFTWGGLVKNISVSKKSRWL